MHHHFLWPLDSDSIKNNCFPENNGITKKDLLSIYDLVETHSTHLCNRLLE